MTKKGMKKGKKGPKKAKEEDGVMGHAMKVYRHGAATFRNAKALAQHLMKWIAPFVWKKNMYEKRNLGTSYTKPVITMAPETKEISHLMSASAFDEVEYKVALGNIQIARETLRAGIGNAHIGMRLAKDFTWVATVTTGVVSQVNSLDPSSSSEFASLAALFDEYKCDGGHIDFNIGNMTNNALVPSANNAFFGLAYDATDNAALASMLAVAESFDHELFCVTSYYATNTFSGKNGDKPTRFSWRVPPGFVQNLGTNSASDAWVATNNPISFGFLKCYHVDATVTATILAAGISYYSTRFRNRL